jgi:hypothetical protein|nr:MAG TPA: YopX protein [Caudoviricetes sp.]
MIPKFRGKSIADENKGEWMCGNLITDKTSAYITDGDIDAYEDFISIERWCSIDVNTVGQSTGLFDKNGVEIFEGDILKDDSESGKVVYDPDRTMWRVYGKDFDDALSDWWMGRVIGNIYENPEP